MVREKIVKNDHFVPIQESLFQTEYHLPFHNYAGPGTRTVANIENGLKPQTLLDAAALVHDIEYYTGNYEKADQNMVTNLGLNFSPFTNATYLGFKLKDLVGYSPDFNINTYSYLKDKVKETGLLGNYNVKFDPELSDAIQSIPDKMYNNTVQSELQSNRTVDSPNTNVVGYIAQQLDNFNT